jgi:hypothetical protein
MCFKLEYNTKALKTVQFLQVSVIALYILFKVSDMFRILIYFVLCCKINIIYSNL